MASAKVRHLEWVGRSRRGAGGDGLHPTNPLHHPVLGGAGAASSSSSTSSSASSDPTSARLDDLASKAREQRRRTTIADQPADPGGRGSLTRLEKWVAANATDRTRLESYWSKKDVQAAADAEAKKKTEAERRKRVKDAVGAIRAANTGER